MKIIISGTSGVGKSTTVDLVAEHYRKEGKEETQVERKRMRRGRREGGKERR